MCPNWHPIGACLDRPWSEPGSEEKSVWYTVVQVWATAATGARAHSAAKQTVMMAVERCELYPVMDIRNSPFAILSDKLFPLVSWVPTFALEHVDTRTRFDSPDLTSHSQRFTRLILTIRRRATSQPSQPKRGRDCKLKIFHKWNRVSGSLRAWQRSSNDSSQRSFARGAAI